MNTDIMELKRLYPLVFNVQHDVVIILNDTCITQFLYTVMNNFGHLGIKCKLWNIIIN